MKYIEIICPSCSKKIGIDTRGKIITAATISEQREKELLRETRRQLRQKLTELTYKLSYKCECGFRTEQAGYFKKHLQRKEHKAKP